MTLRDRTTAGRAVGPLRVASLNLASGRDRTGRSLSATELTDAVAGLDADVIAVQEVDVGQNRSHGDDQPAIVAHALGAVDWRYAATLDGEPRPVPYQSWTPVDPAELRGPSEGRKGPRYGVALAVAPRPGRRPRRAGPTAAGTEEGPCLDAIGTSSLVEVSDRLSNPLRRAARPDPQGAYPRRHGPELAELDQPEVHEPWRLGPRERRGIDYPERLIDLS